MNDQTLYSIPVNWEWASLGEICQVIRMQIEPKLQPSKRFNYLSIENVESNSGELVNFAPTPGDRIKSAKLVFKTSDILYNKLRPYLNKVHFPIFDGISATDLIPLRPLGGIPREYVGYFLRSRVVVDYANQKTRGIQLPRLPVDDLVKLPVPLAPLAEQRRIVARLESSINSIRVAKKALVKIPALVKRFRQSVFAKAFRGQLTERDPNDEPAENLLKRIRQDWRRRWEEELRAKGKDPRKCKYEEPESVEIQGLEELPNTWTWTTLGRVLDVVQYGTSVKADAPPNRGVPILRMGNIKEGKLGLAAMKYMDPRAEDIPKYELKHGDILINRTNSPELVGKSALFDLEGKYVFASYLIRLRAIGLVSPSYLTFLINSPIGRRHIDRVRHQVAGQSNINTHDIKSIPIPLAPSREQFQVAKKIQEMFSLADQVEDSIRNGLTNATILEHSLLTKAFHGELVPQDPKDEPASVFLERIRAKRPTLLNKKGRNQTRLELASPAKITA